MSGSSGKANVTSQSNGAPEAGEAEHEDSDDDKEGEEGGAEGEGTGGKFFQEAHTGNEWDG